MFMPTFPMPLQVVLYTTLLLSNGGTKPKSYYSLRPTFLGEGLFAISLNIFNVLLSLISLSLQPASLALFPPESRRRFSPSLPWPPRGFLFSRLPQAKSNLPSSALPFFLLTSALPVLFLYSPAWLFLPLGQIGKRSEAKLKRGGREALV